MAATRMRERAAIQGSDEDEGSLGGLLTGIEGAMA